MSILEVRLLEKCSGHKDLLVQVSSLPALVLDSYYFALATESNSNISSVGTALAMLLSYWLTAIEKTIIGQKIHIPIDLADQYTGCFEVCTQSESLSIAYGYSRKEGWGIKLFELGDYCTTVTDFQRNDKLLVEINKTAFLAAIRQQIDRLKNLDS